MVQVVLHILPDVHQRKAEQHSNTDAIQPWTNFTCQSLGKLYQLYLPPSFPQLIPNVTPGILTQVSCNFKTFCHMSNVFCYFLWMKQIICCRPAVLPSYAIWILSRTHFSNNFTKLKWWWHFELKCLLLLKLQIADVWRVRRFIWTWIKHGCRLMQLMQFINNLLKDFTIMVNKDINY